MRKASKATIAATLKRFEAWRVTVDGELSACTVPGAAKELRRDVAEIRRRIESGELGACTNALIAHVNRQIRALKEGLYSEVKGSCWTLAK